ncbi:MAG: hypothetical protein FJ194_12070 [Gammaproteobacteria bacterium]|nr:hypothetical protein [Gammaproteobacteria bacterium]
MDYIGIDPVVGLECASCKDITRLPYSELLHLVSGSEQIECKSCDRKMLHDWTTINVVQNIIKKRMRQANEAKERRQKQNTAW